MKRFTFFSMSLLILLAFSTACETTSSDSGTAESETTTKATDEVPESRGLEMATEESLLPGEISLSEAKKRIEDFQALPGTTTFTNGFRLSHDDIVTLIDDKDVDNTHDILAMYAYRDDIDSFDLILSIFIPNPSNAESSGSYRYFNFTKPCPNFCPDFAPLGNETRPTIADLDGHKGYWFGRDDMTSGLQGALSSNSYMALDRSDFSANIRFLVCGEDGCTLDQLNNDPYALFQPCDVPDHPCSSF